MRLQLHPQPGADVRGLGHLEAGRWPHSRPPDRRPAKERRARSFAVSILSEAAWPAYPDVQVLLPEDVLERILEFEKYYRDRYSGRKLTWKPALAHCVVKASLQPRMERAAS